MNAKNALTRSNCQPQEELIDMLSEKKETNKESMKVKELIKLLEANERFLKLIGKHENLITFIRELRTTLKPYISLDCREMLELLRQSLEKIEKAQRELPSIIEEMQVEQIPLDQLKILVPKEDLSKEELLSIAQKRLGIPIGTLKKMSKESARQKILSTIQNIEKLETIGKKAAE